MLVSGQTAHVSILGLESDPVLSQLGVYDSPCEPWWDVFEAVYDLNVHWVESDPWMGLWLNRSRSGIHV